MDLHELYVGCRTYRRFTQEPVGEEIIREALENARIGSSGKNAQPLRYVAVTSPEAVRDMQPLVKWAAALPPEIGTPREGEQPTAFILVIKKADAISFSDVDVGIAANIIATTAWAHGVGSCLMGAINGPKIKERFDIPDEDTLRLAIALGYPAHNSTIVDMPEDGSFHYFVDEKRDYYVPKRAFDDVVRFA
jgi:nitroreductase